MKGIFKNQVILVTGGVGSIGSVIVKQLVQKYFPGQIRIFDNDEEAIFNAGLKYQQTPNIRFLIGDIRDKERVNWAIKDVDYIFHCAALKHVALSEYNPFESVKTNVFGTENVVMAAISQKVKKLINISTDKASIPSSVMGASKLLAERITTAVNYYKGNSPTICASVRFGNVLNSSGSVIPVFKKQIKKGGPLTITDKRMVRYFMTIPQAVNLIFEATKIAKEGEVFILKMPVLKIESLASVLIETLAPQYGYQPQQIKIKEIGGRPGEKISENLLTDWEAKSALELKKMFIIPPLIENPNLKKKEINRLIVYYKNLGAKPIKNRKLRPSKLLNKNQIKKLLREAKII